MYWYRAVKEIGQTVTEQGLQGAEDMVAEHKKSHILECDFLCVWPRKAG